MTRTPTPYLSPTVSATVTPTWSAPGQVFVNRNAIRPALGQDVSITLWLPNGGNTKVMIYNSAGELVRVLSDKEYVPGSMDILTWDGRNDFRDPVAAGVYLIHVMNRYFVETPKIAVLR